MTEKITTQNLQGANLRGANLNGADLTGADLDEAKLTGANLSGANLYGANLINATLINATLFGADLIGADLFGANLIGASLREADLSGAYVGDGWDIVDGYLTRKPHDKTVVTDWSCSGCSALLPESDLGHEQFGERFCDECAGIVSVPENTTTVAKSDTSTQEVDKLAENATSVVTITISREDVIAWATEWSPNDSEPDELSRMIEACREALERNQ